MPLSPALNAAKYLPVPVVYKYKDITRRGYIKKANASNVYIDLLHDVNVNLIDSDIINLIIIEDWNKDSVFVKKIFNSEDLSAYTDKTSSVLNELDKDRSKVLTVLKRLDMISNTYFGLIYLYSKAFFRLKVKEKLDLEKHIKENYFDTDLNKKLYNNFFSFMGFPVTGNYSFEKNELFYTKDLLVPYSPEQLSFIIKWDTEVMKIMNEKKFSEFFISLLIENLNKDLKIIDIELSDPNVNSIKGLKEDLITAKKKIASDKQYVGSLMLTESFYYYNKDNWYRILPSSFKPLLDSQFDNLAFQLAQKNLYTMEGFLDKIEINMTSYV